ncbi:Midasin [Leucoagaricus sp. SymC.cos]|nr:Midasin [Leucoagaricus sp. SymC.cos]
MAATAALFTSPITTASFDASILRDPLTLNLKKQVRTLLGFLSSRPNATGTELGDAVNILSVFVNGTAVGPVISQVLDSVSRFLSVPQFSQVVVRLFRPLLVDLFARWLGFDERGELQEARLSVLAYVVEVFEELYPILYEFLTKFFPNGPLHLISAVEHSTLPQSISTERLHRLLLIYFRIQQANRDLPGQLYWSLSPLTKLIWSRNHNLNDNGVKILAIRCYALQSGMGEAQREKLEAKVLGMKEGEMCSVDCWISDGGLNRLNDNPTAEVEGSNMLDGWVLPALEMQRVNTMREEMCHGNGGFEEFYAFGEGEEVSTIEEKDLSSRVANVHGILFLRHSTISPPSTSLIPTPTSIASLRALALHISMRVPTLLTSTPSAGKASLLNHLASILYPGSKNHIITIHLADTSLDPRSLLGSYISSPIQPGNFEWKEGVLVRAMREGRWVVFEDIDRGSNEVLGVLKPLVESLRLGNWIGARAKLDVPSRGTVTAHQNFLIFATRSVQPSRKGRFTSPTFFGAHIFCETIVKAPEGAELNMIVERRFGRLAGPAARGLIDLWASVQGLGEAASVRSVGLRELEKLCARVERLLSVSHQPMDIEYSEEHALPLWQVFTNPSLREEIYLEARDVFFGAGTTTASAKMHLDRIAIVVGERLGLDEERRIWLVKGRKPAFDVEKNANGDVVGISVGRTRLATRQRKNMSDLPPLRPFAMHRPAVCLLSRIATSIAFSEPVLLTGETGTGKTSVITHLTSLLGRSLISLNLSHQTESSDLIGGLKPVDTRVPASALQERFLELFGATFSRKKNEKFETEVRKAMNEARWKRVVGLWRESGRLARERLAAKETEELSHDRNEPDAPRKRRKVDSTESSAAWAAFLKDVDEFDVQHVQGKGKFAFGFVEGPLVKALRSGDWILLDEINLASPETLECISGLLHGPTASITLTEQGSLEPVPRHPDFRLFACMNPATDVGKKDLPPNIRSRFTEIDVPPPDADKDTLLSIINQYIGACAAGDKGIIMNVAEFYIAVKDLAEKRQLADGANQRPHFSMRTLARALTFAADLASTYSLRRSVWEGCLMAFTMVLDPPSVEIVMGLMHKHLLVGVRNPKSMLRMEPSIPHGRSSKEFVKFGPFYLERGPHPEDPMEEYIMTPSVETKLVDLARIITTRRFPVLIEGPTSSGKTSSVEYLARRTGHRFVRINNHEHTDIQEYLGSYVSDLLTGKLVFKDGLLVHALRNGDWIVLDELNLAPTDVLEALNRLLDDNRELVIPETQEVVRPHPHFMLFATQNPSGLYAGRKVLSRAFRNRFLEVHFQDVPQAELESILCQRCRIAPSYGKRIVSVFRELQKRRQAGRIFESKQSFATLRDLFRWANRDAVGYQELADNGYMLLAERARREDDKAVVKEVIQSIIGVQIRDTLYDLHQTGIDMTDFLGAPVLPASNIIWTKAMQRLYILVCRALKFNEPVLLVGETGSGKTSVCQVFADATNQRLHGLNCHQNTETADIIGALRPLRNRTALEAEVFQETFSALASAGVEPIDSSFDNLAASLTNALKLSSAQDNQQQLSDAYNKLLRLQSIFEWHDGPLIEAMRNGDVFLLDEISLADDSVLERLNSVLEPGRTIVLAEKGGSDFVHPTVKAANAFKLVATMNPGGDYGKKELSPALRNRFTEIWVPRVDDRTDLEMIVDNLWKHVDLNAYTSKLLDYTEWLSSRIGDKSITSLRDIIAWVMFSNAVYAPGKADAIPAGDIFHHAAQMTYLDGLSSLPQLSGYSRDALSRLKNEAMVKLQEMVPSGEADYHGPVYDPTQYIQLGLFAIKKGPLEPQHQLFNLTAPTSRNNAMRILRACQLSKPILLEGSPGVGKTSLVTALANISGHHLRRINLSDQTDLIDLFGSDLPVEGGTPGEFAWRDAEFLRALQQGHWVLLDEMNLAPQAVLEGLNAVLDHRGTVYIPELGKTFTCHPSFRIFAAQNPQNQGGGRKGLPKSFVNRFTKVYVDEFTPADLLLVCQHMFPQMDEDVLRAMISFNSHLNDEVTVRQLFGRQGAPWEFNLRDVIRWGCLLTSSQSKKQPVTYLRSIYLQRFRANEDRRRAQGMFDKIFATSSPPFQRIPSSVFTPSQLQIGHISLARNNFTSPSRPKCVIKSQLPAFEALGDCISQGWLAILTGPRDSGKSCLIHALADSTGNSLREVSINSSTDTMDIIGSFEQADAKSQTIGVIRDVLSLVDQHLRNLDQLQDAHDLLSTRDSLLLATCHPLTQDTVPPLLKKVLELLSGFCSPPTLFQDVSQRIEALLRSITSFGRFEWVDGPLIQAMRRGEWLLLDGANLCSPSVLDRLNSLCEPNGQLTLNERGLVHDTVEIVKPHPNFRLFMTVDPQHGELSRAMRNRGVEIFLPLGLLPDDYLVMLDHLRLPRLQTIVEHSNALAMQFQSHRRGLTPFTATQTNRFASSGRLLDQFTALFSVTDRLPLYLTPTNDIGLDAASFFLFRTFHHAYIPYFRRVLDTCHGTNEELKQHLHSVINFLSSPQLSSIADRVKGTLMQIRESSIEVLCAQVDTLLHILDFLAATFLQNAIPSLLILNKCGRYLHTFSAQTPLNYSAIQVIARMINEGLDDAPAQVQRLRHHGKRLQEVTSLSSGTGLVELWTKWKCSDAIMAPRHNSSRCSDLTSFMDDPDGKPDLRRQALRLLSITSLSHKTPEHEAQVAEIVSVLQKQPIEKGRAHGVIGATPGILTLRALSRPLEYVYLEKLLILVSRSPRESLRHYVPIQQLSWVLEALDVSPKYIQSISAWLGSLFNNSQPYASNTDNLLDPSQLNISLALCDPGRFNLELMADYEREIDLYLDTVLADTDVPRHDKVAKSLSVYEPRVEMRTKTNRDLREFLGIFLGEPIGEGTSASVLRNHLEPLQALVCSTPEQRLWRLGRAWVAVGSLLLQLIIPDTPVDPLAIQNTAAFLQQRELDLISSEMNLHRSLEGMTTGNCDNFILSVLQCRLSAVLASRVDSISVVGREIVGRLHTYWAEVWQFRNQVISEGKISSLLHSFAASHVEAALREQVIQESITGFQQRLDSIYPEFGDLNVLLKLAVSQLRLGLRLVAKAKSINPGTTKIIESLVDYPSILERQEPSRDLQPAAHTAFKSVYQSLVSLSLQALTKLKLKCLLPQLEHLYDQALGLWLIDKAKAAEVEAASQSLYRGSVIEHNTMTDAEVEEQEFLALFPSFEDSLSSTTDSINQKSRVSQNLTDHDMVLLSRLHLDLFTTSVSLQEGLKRVSETKKHLLSEALGDMIHELPDTIDASSLVYRLRFINVARANFETPAKHDSSYNFYRDPNISELKAATQVVTALRTFLQRLLVEWPEQMVLQHLIDRCDIVLTFSVKSPVAKVLSALEQLLLQTEDWEMYANRDNSLSLHRQALTDLIVRWRRMELSCWDGLLEYEAKSFAEGTSEWWFRLQNAMCRGLLDAMSQNEDASYLKKLIPLIDEFMSSSPLGQFSFRLQLLQSFERYLSELSSIKGGLEERCLRRVVCILHSTLRYYQLHHPELQSYLAEQRAALDKEIKSFIKLASWKDINVQALKQSAQKTHHQLYKIIRKFREVLKEPILPKLKSKLSLISERRPFSHTPRIQNAKSQLPIPRGIVVATAGPLSDLNIAFGKFDNVISTKLLGSLSHAEHNEAEELAVSIITISKELSEIPIPTGLSSERRTKFLKSLLVRKRKAFSDLLKELKKTGLSGHVKPEVLRQNSDTLWLRDQPILRNDVPDLDVGKSETYFSRLLASLPELRASLSNHHSDLQTRELQRGLWFLESGFSMAIDLRARLAAGLDEADQFKKIYTRLSNLAESDMVVFQEHVFSQIQDITGLTCRLSAALTEAAMDLNVFLDLQRDAKKVPIHDVEKYLEKCMVFKAQLLQIEHSLDATRLAVLSQGEYETVLATLEFFNSCTSLLSQWSSTYPYLQYIFDPIKQWLSSEDAVCLKLVPSYEEQPPRSIEPLLIALLYTVQVMVAETNKLEGKAAMEEEEEEQRILRACRKTRNLTHLLSLTRILQQVIALLAGISSADGLKQILHHILPFLSVYQNLVQNQLATHAQWTRAIFKLNFVLCSTLLKLSNEGFCQPPETEEGEGEGEGETLEAADGTGLGEGSGTENISKEIEDESQVEGLKGEDEEKEERSKDGGDDNAVEMSEDFGGALEDVPDDGVDEEEDDRSNAESEADPEERLEDLDPADPSALDENIWGDEKGPQDSESKDDKTGKDHSEEQNGPSEVVAKESNNKPEKDKGKDVDKDAKEKEQEDDGKELEEAEAEDDEGEPNAAGAPMEDHIQDTNTLDLPDNMELDIGEEEKDKDASDEELEGETEDILDGKPTEDLGSDGEMADDKLPTAPEQDTSPDEGVGHEDVEMEAMEAKAEDDQPELDHPEEEIAPEEVTARPDTSTGDGDVNPNDEAKVQDQDISSTGQAGSSAAGSGQNRTSQEKAMEQTGSYDNPQEQSAEEIADDGEGNAASGIQQGQNQSSAEQRNQVNPLRSLGDTLEDIKQHLAEILNSEPTDVPKPTAGPSEAPHQLEYLEPDDDDQGMQALGPAGQEQVAKLDELKFSEDDGNLDPSFAMDVDEPPQYEKHENAPELLPSQVEQSASSLRDNVEGAIIPGEAPQAEHSPVMPDPSLLKAAAEIEEEEVNGGDVEAELRQWQAADFPDSKAEHIWRLYESMTHDLAYALCEQLRLILEPTLATRLRGDFRTGKRLNMKKIIPYIASDYTKDKIWLRRTKPSQREYQVLIAIDDSRSMAESHSIHLAYQTLALISKALHRLEAGDIAIAKFGGSVDVLHGFDQGPFTDQAGTQVVNAFTFKQKATNVLSLVDTSLKVLESARERRSMSSASAADLWQLEIIISDGICQDHDKLRTLLRKAEEQKVMIVFIVLDSLHSNAAPGLSSSKDANAGSILTMTKAEFKNVDGKMEMQLRKYLDSFPFEYYVVLRNVEALPEVLAGTLKQFFERISEE